MVLMNIKTDRGIELNKRRLKEEFTDISLVIEGHKFPAHRMIVSMHSDYLRILTNENSDFLERCDNQYVIKGVKKECFSSILEYFYTGAISIEEANVFDILETCHFLQINNDPLLTQCTKWMIQRLDPLKLIDVMLLAKMWNYSELFHISELKTAVLKYIDCHFETLVCENLLDFLGHDELEEILSRPELCIRSEKGMWDVIFKWINENHGGDNEQIAKITAKLFQSFPEISKDYVRTSISHYGDMSTLHLDKLALEESNFSRNCQSCFMLCIYQKDESDIQGIKQYMEERKQYQYFIAWEFNQKGQFKSIRENDKRVWKEIGCLQQGNSFYQHYGPIKMRNGTLICSGKFLYYLGGGKLIPPSSHRASSIDSFFSGEAYVFELCSLNWLRLTQQLPQRLLEFGAVFHGKHLYLVGGLTDTAISQGSSIQHDFGGGYFRKLAISRNVYRIKEDDWFGSSSKWKIVTELPKDRVSFAVLSLDCSKICAVGRDFCDVLDTETMTWTSIELDKQRSQFNGQKTPLVASLGSLVYVICSKCPEKGSNSMWTIDLSKERPIWQPLLPGLDLRFDPVKAFTHNGFVYVMGKQTEDGNFAYKFDPRQNEWSLLYDKFGGNFVPHNGVLIQKQLVNKSFFVGSHAF